MGFPAGGAIALPIGPQFNKPGGGLFAQPPAPTGTAPGTPPSGFDDFGLEAGTYGNVGLAETGAPLVFGPKMGGGDEYRLLNPSGQSVTATFGSLQDAFNFMSNTPIDPTTGDYAPQAAPAPAQAAPAPAPATPALAPALTERGTFFNEQGVEMMPQLGFGGAKAIPYQPQPSATMPQPLPAPSGFNVNQAAASALQEAIGSTRTGLGFTPMGISPVSYRPSQIAGTDLSPYTNPYESMVVDQALEDLERTRQIQQRQGGAQATAARAFGGSRQAIVEAERDRAFAEQAARTSAGLRQQGYQSALGLAGRDIGAQTEAARFAAQQAAAAQAQNLAAQQAAMSMRLGAAGQLAGLGQQAFGTGQAIQQQQMQQGLLQQGLQQQLIDAARGQYAGYIGSPMAATQAPLAALGVTPVPQSTTAGMQPGLFDYLKLPFMFASM